MFQSLCGFSHSAQHERERTGQSLGWWQRELAATSELVGLGVQMTEELWTVSVHPGQHSSPFPCEWLVTVGSELTPKLTCSMVFGCSFILPFWDYLKPFSKSTCSGLSLTSPTFDSVQSAQRAKASLNGADIYSGCCTLKIEYAKVGVGNDCPCQLPDELGPG